MSAALVLFDDRTARDWMPLALTRPAGELRFGASTLRERAERVFGLPCLGHLAAPHLRGFDEPGAPPVLEREALPADRDLVFLSSRAVVDRLPRALHGSGRPTIVRVAGEPCGWFAPAGAPRPPAAFLDEPARHAPDDLPTESLDGEILERPWHLITGNAKRVAADIVAQFGDRRDSVAAGVHVLGDAPLVIGEGAEVEPGAVIDLREGPVWLDAGARVAAFTRLAGPAYIGPASLVLGGHLAAVSIGPRCKIRGEVADTVVLGYSNKAHDGFIGHAYLGCWVNLGAMTTNSDLKNNYGSVRVWTPSGEMDTGEVKLGCLLGDHVKTAIGTFLTTGTLIGAGSNIFGASPPKYVPPFTWGTGKDAGAYALEKFLQTAEIVMARRDVKLTDGQRALLRAAWHHGRGDG